MPKRKGMKQVSDINWRRDDMDSWKRKEAKRAAGREAKQRKQKARGLTDTPNS